jgi:long-subunit acyl-CoA synthetase (AMP-forming)
MWLRTAKRAARLSCAPWLTGGYYKDPDKSEELWTDGWLHTGDVANVNEQGYVQIVDRLRT